MKATIAVAGAGIYGANIAIRLAEHGHRVTLFDPLGLLCAASSINQCRVHAGYHYPRSPETIREVLESRDEFIEAFRPAILKNTSHYYAIPHEGSHTSPLLFEEVMRAHEMNLRNCRPPWMDFNFIDQCYEVEEELYDAKTLKELLHARIQAAGITFKQKAFLAEMRPGYDHVIWATYGLGESRKVFPAGKYQIAEKALVQLPAELRGVSLVVIDGPFTAFDPYGSSGESMFGSAKHTNHWSASDPAKLPPDFNLLNRENFQPYPDTKFDAMREAAALAVPLAREAAYLGSRFTIRVVEDSPADRRTLYIRKGEPGELHIFSGKVVSAVKAARLVCEQIRA